MRLSQPQYTSNVIRLGENRYPSIWELAHESNKKNKIVRQKFVTTTERVALT